MNLLKQSIQRVMFKDGLLEVFLGIFLLIFGLVFIFQPKLAPFSALIVFVMNPAIERVKRKYVFPRSGYLKPIKENKKEATGIVATAVISFVLLVVTLVVLVVLKGAEEGRLIFMRWIFPPISGALFAFGPLWLARRYGLKRGYVMAVLLPLTGIVLTVTGLASGYTAVGILCSVAGLFSLISGGVLFAAFLRSNPLPENVHE